MGKTTSKSIYNLGDFNVTYTKDVLGFIRDVYKTNSFVKLCNISIDDVSCGKAVLSMTIDSQKHTNLYGAVHGGALESLADTALGVVSATEGARVVTLNFSMSFIKNIKAGEKATAVATIKHHGRTTIVVDVDMFNEKGQVMCKTMATMYVIGNFDEIPRKW